MRTLASIQRITNLAPINGADKIEVANVLGWHVVVKKGEFQAGELCIYVEIDSLLPIRQEFSFLQSGGIRNMIVDGKTVSGYRLKTIKLRGQISQGICFPLSILPQVDIGQNEGNDVTELLGIIKYEIPVPAQLVGKMRGNFPGFLPKTDETRIQAYPDVLMRCQDIPFYVTEKLDGSSCTFVIKNTEFHVCSRNIDLLDDGKNTLWRLAKEMQIEEKLRSLPEERYAIQGEIVGEGIQKNPLKIKGQKIFFFNIYDFIGGKYLDYAAFQEFFRNLNLSIVPILTDEYLLPKTVDEIVSYATKRSVLSAEAWAEGFVFRPLKEMTDEDLGRLSFKAINPEFLLKDGE